MLSTEILRIPPLSDLILRPWEPRGNEICSQPAGYSQKKRSGWLHRAETRGFSMIKAHLNRRRLSRRRWLVLGHTGAGGARSRAISDRISWNICRGTATSAIWKVT